MSDANPIDSLRKLNPVALKVYTLDGGEKTVAVPKVRNRWLRTYQVIETMTWTRIEALDKGGAVLGVVEDDSMLEDAVESVEGDERDLRMAKVLLEVMRSTQKETRAMFETQMRGQAELVEALIGGVRSIAQSYETSMAIERTARVAEAAGGVAGSNPEVMAMLQLAVGMMHSKPALPAEGKKP